MDTKMYSVISQGEPVPPESTAIPLITRLPTKGMKTKQKEKCIDVTIIVLLPQK